MLKLIATNGTVSDLIAYCRTLGMMHDASTSNLRITYSVDTDVLVSTAYAAVYIHRNLISKFKLLSNLLRVDNDSWLL